MTAAGSGGSGPLPLFTPPQTPGGPSYSSGSNLAAVAGVKRESIASETSDEPNRDKRRRIAPTLVEVAGEAASAPPAPPQGGN
jgi:hypothetical protein